MPFERIKIRLNEDSTAQNLWKKEQEQKRNMDLRQFEIAESKRLQKEQFLAKCFTESGIDILTDQIVTIDPSINKKKESSWIIIKRKHHLFKDDTITEIHIYNVINMGNRFWVGFTEQGTLAIDGKEAQLISERDWRSNPALIEKALENAYLNPYIPPENIPDLSNMGY